MFYFGISQETEQNKRWNTWQ